VPAAPPVTASSSAVVVQALEASAALSLASSPPPSQLPSPPSLSVSARASVVSPPRPLPAAIPTAAPLQQNTYEQPLPDGLGQMDWGALQMAASNCQACGLCAQRQHSVFGTGSLQAQWLVLGDAPGEAENATGQPFAGDAGRLLDNMLKAVGLSRDGEGEKGAYLIHATQCPTPDARNPAAQELSRCAAFIERKVFLLKPRVILVMGRYAMQALLQSTEPLGKMRGRVHLFQGVPVVVTYPAAYLLRNTEDKGKAWADLCLALKVVQDSQIS